MMYVSRAQWGARAAKSRTTLRSSKGLGVHYNGPALGLVDGCRNGLDCAAAVRVVQEFHMDKRGWSDIAYSWLVCPSCGRIFEGRGWGAKTAANGTNAGNWWGHAVMVLVGEDEPMTGIAISAVLTVRKEHARRFGGADELRPHSSFKATACPGDAIRAWLASGARGAAQSPRSEAPASTPSTSEDFMASLPTVKHGDRGAAVRRVQALLLAANHKIAVDGAYGPDTAKQVVAYQKARRLKADGVVGNATWRSLLGV